MANSRLNCRPYASRRVWIPRFNLETNIKFIEEYRKHPCLWDPGDPHYMKHAPRYRAYEDISKAMAYPGLDASSVRAKIKIMRSCYISSRKQIASKAGTSTPHKPVDWFWAADSFLHDVIRLGFKEPSCINEEYQYLRQHFEISSVNAAATEAEVFFGSDMPVCSTVEVVETLNYDEEIEQEDKIHLKTEVIEESRLPDNSIYLELDEDQLLAIENGEMSIEDVTARAEAAATQHHQAVRVSDRETAREPMRTDEDEVRSHRTADSDGEDEFDAFGRCVALQLKTLPIETALELESQIHNLITKKRMVLLRKNKTLS